MDFIQAVKMMKEGKKVRRPSFDSDNYWYLADNDKVYTNGVQKCIYHSGDKKVVAQEESYLADDWEVYDNWNLSQEVHYGDEICGHGTKVYYQEKVKKCRDLILEDLRSKKDFNMSFTNYDNAKIIVNKRFGDL